MQFGSFAHHSLLAGAGSFELGRNFLKTKFRPRIGFRAEATSGGVDNSPNGSVHTFLPLFPSPPYAGRNALLAPANLIQVSPTFRASLKRITLFLDSPFSWRSSSTDGIYNFADILIRPGNRTDARFVGAQPGGQIDVHLNRHWTAGIGYSHFFAGEFLEKDSSRQGRGLFRAFEFVAVLSSIASRSIFRTDDASAFSDATPG